jgi:hypothetical protein
VIFTLMDPRPIFAAIGSLVFPLMWPMFGFIVWRETWDVDGAHPRFTGL